MSPLILFAIVGFLVSYAWVRACWPADHQIVSFFFTIGITCGVLLMAFIVFPYLMGVSRILSPT